MVQKNKVVLDNPLWVFRGFLEFPQYISRSKPSRRNHLRQELMVCYMISDAVFWSIWAPFPGLWQETNISSSGFWETINKLIIKYFAKIPCHTQLLNNKGRFVTSECFEIWSEMTRVMFILELMFWLDFVFFSRGVVLWAHCRSQAGVSDLGLATWGGRHFDKPRKGSSE